MYLSPKVLLLVLSIIAFMTNPISGQNITVNGAFKKCDEKSIFFEVSRNPFTEQSESSNVAIDSSGEFSFSLKSFSPRQINFRIGEHSGYFIAIPNSSIFISADLTNFDHSLELTGNYLKLTKFKTLLFEGFTPSMDYYNKSSQDWNKLYDEILLFTKRKTEILDSIFRTESLTDIEYKYARAEIKYGLYDRFRHYLEVVKIPLEDSRYSFFDFLDITDNESALLSEKYNSCVEWALLRKYLLDNKLPFSSVKPDSAFFFQQYFYGKKILTQNVADVFLTRMVSRILDQGITGSDLSFEMHANDCNSDTLREIIKSIYLLNKYVSLRGDVVDYSFLNERKGFSEFIQNYKGSNLLLVFWASWCSPCLELVPDINKLASMYKKNELTIVHIGINDSESRLKYAIEKYKIGGLHLLLTDNIKNDWKKIIQFYTIPYFAIFNKESKLVDEGPLGLKISQLSNIIGSLVKQK